MIKKVLNQFGYGIAGLLLASAGLMLLWGYKGPTGIKVAAVDTPYTTNWTAQKLITICCRVGNFTGEIALGVSEWKVTGTMGSVSFDETWKTPAVGAKALFGQGGSQGTIQADPSNSGFDANKWLIGLSNPGQDNRELVLKERAVSEVRSFLPSNDDAFGNGAVIGDGNPFRFSSGAYGWFQRVTLNDQYAGGLFMPLEWNVTGTLTDN